MLKPILDAVGKSAEARDLAVALYDRLAPQDMSAHPAAAWAALARDALEFMRIRKPGTALIRVFNPRMEKHGWELPRSVVQIVNDDMPFLVDSVSNVLGEQGIGVHALIHPVVSVQRDASGKLQALGTGAAESVMHIEIDRLDGVDAKALAAKLTRVLDDVRASVEDWPRLRARMQQAAEQMLDRPGPVPTAVLEEAREFLRWAADDHFTFLGYREYRVEKRGKEEMLVAVDGSGLGLLRDEDASKPRPLKSMDAHQLQKSGVLEPLILSKTNARARVHRRGYMDYIGVVTFDAKGRPLAEKRFIGLFTSSAYNRRPWEIPVVRTRFERVMEGSGLPASGHSAKALRHILETLPRDELFQSTDAELLGLGSGVLGLQERVDSKLFIRRDRYGRF